MRNDAWTKDQIWDLVEAKDKVITTLKQDIKRLDSCKFDWEDSFHDVNNKLDEKNEKIEILKNAIRILVK